MARLNAVRLVSLDGVLQAPGRPDEDERGEARRGGWIAPYFDATAAQVAGDYMQGEQVTTVRPELSKRGERTSESWVG